MTVLVLSNATAARARRHLESLRRALPEPGTRHVVSESPVETLALLGHDRWQPDDLLIINGGDGTVQHALSALMTRCAAERLPRIACLPGGTTNMTAFDLNRHRRFDACLASLGAAARGALPSALRPVVRVNGSRADRCGMFFGAGTIVDGIEYFHARVRGRAGGHELGAGVALARTLWGLARRQPPFHRPLALELRGSGGAEHLSIRLLLATTLDRLFLGIRPYWGDGAGSLKCTVVESRAPGFLVRVPRLLRGRPDHRMHAAHGYRSGRCERLKVAFRGSYTLDGELFESDGDTMSVSASPPLRFVPL